MDRNERTAAAAKVGPEDFRGGEDFALRDRLMLEAMKMLANQGINGPSLRSIVRASGAANPSALHYHFRDRESLVRAIARQLQTWYEARALPRLEALRQSGNYSVRDVLEAVFGPVIDMLQEQGLGVDAVRFIARLGWDFGHEGQDISSEFHRRSMLGMLELLLPLFSEVDPEDLKFKIMANMNTAYNGLAYRSYMWRSPFGASPLARTENAARLRELHMRYLEGGLRS
jgi:AcrR family transcriptional regulator